MEEKENSSFAMNDEIVASSQGSEFNPTTSSTQRLHLELEDETEKLAPETQIMSSTSPKGGSGEKRPATGNMSEPELEAPPKFPKLDLDKSVIVEEEDMFSDTEASNIEDSIVVVNISEDKTKSIEIVTLGDSISSDSETESPKPKKIDENKAVEKNIMTKVEPQDDETNTGDDNSSIKESSNDDNPEPANEEVNIANAVQTSTPDQGRLNSDFPNGNTEIPKISFPNSQTNSSLEDSQVNQAGENETLKITSSPEEEVAEKFKTPEENDSRLVIAVIKASEYKQISGLCKIEEHFFLPKCKKVPSNFAIEMQKHAKHLMNTKGLTKRLSDVSGLSAGSSGYQADTSSIGTGSGSSSNRDRLSIMPETLIESHNVLSPLPSLPKRLWSQKQKNVIEKNTKKSEPAVQKIKDNMKVFAKWVERTDIKFWPGIIKQEEAEQDDKHLIVFEDGYEKTVKKEDFIRADALVPGCQVNVEKDQGVHQVGVLLTYPDCSQSEIHFTVQLEGAPNLPETEAEAISWKKVHLTMDQWKKIQEELGVEKSVKSANVSLDNLVTGKRRSKPVTPVKSLTKKRAKKGGEHVETSAQSESDLNGQIENTSDEEINNQTTPKRTRLPRKPIFKNMVFLLTQGKPKHTDDQDLGESAMESETEDDDEEVEKIEENKFNRKELVMKIEDNGGKVLKKFPGDKEKIPEHVILISDRMCGTMTYLLSIAYGFERVNFMWIHNCTTKKELLPRQNYALQVGFSSHQNRDIEHLEAKGNRRELFKGLHILIATSVKDFGEDWKPILLRIGASVSVRTQGKLDKSLKKIDVIIGNSTPPSTIVKDAMEKNMFVVTSKWIVQCLINGEVIPYGDYLI